MEKMLNYYGFETIEAFANSVGMHEMDAARLLAEMYEEDILFD